MSHEMVLGGGAGWLALQWMEGRQTDQSPACSGNKIFIHRGEKQKLRDRKSIESAWG